MGFADTDTKPVRSPVQSETFRCKHGHDYTILYEGQPCIFCEYALAMKLLHYTEEERNRLREALDRL